jgi:hypothetical protein
LIWYRTGRQGGGGDSVNEVHNRAGLTEFCTLDSPISRTEFDCGVSVLGIAYVMLGIAEASLAKYGPVSRARRITDPGGKRKDDE